MTTHLTLIRDRFTSKTTTGVMLVDGEYQCLVLEDRIRAPGLKVKGATAIPAGHYKIERTFSNRFRRIMPQLMNVPGFEGVRIHSGNTEHDTEGCLLVGCSRGVDSISLSQIAFQALDKVLFDACKAGEVWITIAELTPPKELLA